MNIFSLGGSMALQAGKLAVNLASKATSALTARPSASTGNTDSATISADAMQRYRLMSALGGMSMLGGSRGGGGAICLDELRGALEAKSSGFRKELNDIFAANGVDTGTGINLTSDSSGKVRVLGDHPDKVKIEAIFEDNPELANEFHSISALSGLVSAAGEQSAFSGIYEQDPFASVQQYSSLYSPYQAENRFVFGFQDE